MSKGLKFFECQSPQNRHVKMSKEDSLLYIDFSFGIILLCTETGVPH